VAGNASSATNRAVLAGRILEGPDHRRSDGNDPPAACARTADERGRGVRDPVWLIEGQPSVELRIARGGNAGSMGERREWHTPAA
jgi:hypothetical protein